MTHALRVFLTIGFAASVAFAADAPPAKAVDSARGSQGEPPWTEDSGRQEKSGQGTAAPDSQIRNPQSAIRNDPPPAKDAKRREAERELRRQQAELERLNDRLQEYRKELDGMGLPGPARPGAAGSVPFDESVTVTCDADAHGRTVVTIEAGGATLGGTLAHIAAAVRMELTLDRRVPYRSLSSLVTVSLNAVTLREALDLLLGRFGLDYTVSDDGIVVAPPSMGPAQAPEERLAVKAEAAYQMALVRFPANEAAPRAHLTLGQQFHARGLYPQAVEQLRRLVNEYPHCEQVPAAFYTIAQSYAALGDRKQSAETYHALLNRYVRCPLADESLLALARGHVAEGHPAEAVPLFQEILKLYRGSNSCLAAEEELGQCLLAMGNYEEARARFEALSGKDVPDAVARRARLALGRALTAQGKHGAARAELLRLMGRFPGTPEATEAYYLIADAYFSEKDYLAAVEAYRGALAKAPKSSEAEVGKLRLGGLYRSIALYDLAAAVYERILSEHPDTACRGEVLEGLAECYWAKESYQKAQIYFERAANDGGDAAASPRRLLRAGQAALADRRPGDALPLLGQVAEGACDRATATAARQALGDCLRQLGRAEEALAAYHRAAAEAAEQGDPKP